MNINDFAVIIAEREGKKKQVNIAQIKEILRITKEELDYFTGIDIYKVIRKL